MLTWEEVEGRKTAKARLVAEGYPDPDRKDGSVDLAGCVSGRSRHRQLISSGAWKGRKIRSLDIKTASRLADRFDLEASVLAPCAWDPKDARGIWK